MTENNTLHLSSRSLNFLKNSVAELMPDYESRSSQLKMVEECSKIIEDGGIIIAEAGTGTGKTFAYLIPAILSGKKTIVSTKTLNLQAQLISKDLKFLSGLIPFDYTAAKGRSNYVCLRRLNAFRPNNDNETVEYRELIKWTSMTETGDSEDYSSKIPVIWLEIYSDPDACKGRKCGYFNQCFYFIARKRWEKAQIVVANHALISINAMLPEESKILPDADILIIDEGHSLDHILSEQIGLTLSKRGFESIANRLLKMDERGIYKGLLSKSPHLFSVVESTKTDMELLWLIVKKTLKHKMLIRGDSGFEETVAGIANSLNLLIQNIRESTTGLFKEDEEIEIRSALIKLKTFAAGLHTFTQGMDGFVRWAEIEEKRISLRMSPIYPKDFVMENILPQYRSVILTSATLSVNGNFDFIKNILGFNKAKMLTLPSPFDLKKQVLLDIKTGINLQNEDGVAKLARVIIQEASKKDGGVLVLFTSKEIMNKTWGAAIDELYDLGLNPMLQGDLPKRLMLETMRDSDNSVIFGLDSFWEGVDVKGNALRCLIITKLPFEVPSEPIVMARTEEIEKNGGNPFYEYSLPKAILKFKQGIGRLIRSNKDSGRVIICDERIKTRAYGDRKSVV